MIISMSLPFSSLKIFPVLQGFGQVALINYFSLGNTILAPEVLKHLVWRVCSLCLTQNEVLLAVWSPASLCGYCCIIKSLEARHHVFSFFCCSRTCPVALHLLAEAACAHSVLLNPSSLWSYTNTCKSQDYIAWGSR